MGFLVVDEGLAGGRLRVEFRLLGPVEVWAAGRRVDAGQPRQRSVLAVLLAEAGRPVPVERLIDSVWGDSPPHGARHSLHGHITRIRQVLRQAGDADGSSAGVVFASNCYRLDPGDIDAVDLHRFRRLAGRARGDGPVEQRVRLLREAIGLWRGEPLSGLAGPWVEQSRLAWLQQYLDAVVVWGRAEIEVADPGAAIEILTEVSERFPLTEPVTVVLMRALAATGRPAEALARYDDTRRRLSEELGTDPSADLQAVYHAILQGDSPSPAPVPSRAPRTLPADIEGFVGRDDELKRLLAATAGPARTVAIHAVDGMAGVGKTAFAVHAAHHLAARFPDGQQFVALRAHAPGQARVEASTALETLLQADGVAMQQIPEGLDARAGLWRERMAGKRLLLVLDDAGDPAQVEPLLPAAPGCLVLITSRRKLATLPGATLLSLDTLPAGDAAVLFTHRVGARADREPAAVERITELCGYLPLAIALTAARLHSHPAWTVADLADDLAEACDRLTQLASGDLAVAAAFGLSYQDLPADRQRLFRRLALQPGPDLDAYAAAALDATTVAAARRGLEHLLEHNLLTEPHRGRYRFHDLIAEHARDHAATDPPADRDAARDRLLSYYAHTAGAAAVHHRDSNSPVPAAPGGTPLVEAPALTDAAQAADWFAAELANLVAATEYGAGRDHPAAIAISGALHHYLRSRGPFGLAVRLHRTVLATALRIGDLRPQAHALANLADVRRLAGDWTAGADDAERAHSLYRDLGDQLGQAQTLVTLAWVGYLRNDHQAATVHAEKARTLFHRLGNRHGQAYISDTLARIRMAIGEYHSASTDAEQALRLYREVADLRGQAYALNTLAHLQDAMGDRVAAIANAEQARDFFEQLGNRLGQANILHTMSHMQLATGDYPAAAGNAGQAHALYRQLGSRLGQAHTLVTQARVRHATADYAAAAATIDQAMTICQEIGNRYGHACAFQVRGIVHHAVGDHQAAAAALDRALDAFLEIADPNGEAETRISIGRLLLDTGEPVAAHQQFTAALRTAQHVGLPQYEAEALEGIGRSRLHQGERDEGIPLLRRALTIYERLDSPHAATLRATVAAPHQLPARWRETRETRKG